MKKAIDILLLSALMFALTSSPILAQGKVTCRLDVIVQRDDWLSKLAEKFLDDASAHPAIADATNAKNTSDPSYAKIEDVNLIDVGWRLCMPGPNAQAGLVLVVPAEPASVQAGILDADIISAWNQLVKTQSIGHYLDWATPTFYNTLAVSLQELGDGQVTAEEFVQKLQADYAAFQTSQ